MRLDEEIRDEFIIHCTDPISGETGEVYCWREDLARQLFELSELHQVRVTKREVLITKKVIGGETAVKGEHDRWKSEREAFYARTNKWETFGEVVSRVCYEEAEARSMNTLRTVEGYKTQAEGLKLEYVDRINTEHIMWQFYIK